MEFAEHYLRRFELHKPTPLDLGIRCFQEMRTCTLRLHIAVQKGDDAEVKKCSEQLLYLTRAGVLYDEVFLAAVRDQASTDDKSAIHPALLERAWGNLAVQCRFRPPGNRAALREIEQLWTLITGQSLPEAGE